MRSKSSGSLTFPRSDLRYQFLVFSGNKQKAIITKYDIGVDG